MKTLLRSSVVTLLLIGSYAGISASTNAPNIGNSPSVGLPGAPRPDTCNCMPGPSGSLTANR